MTKRHHAVLLAAALFATLPAHAQLRADTALGNLQWNVIDLTPADGQSAGYVPLDTSHYRQVRTEVFSATPPDGANDLQSTGDDAVVLDSTSTFGTAWSTGQFGPGFGVAHVTAAADDTLGTGGYATTNASGGFDFTLLPHTRLEISGRASWADVHAAGGADTAAIATSYLIAGALSGEEPPFPIQFELTRSTSAGAADTSGYEDFTLVYLNETDMAMTTSFYVSLNANVTAVPEPSQLAMLFAGMGTLAALARRRRAT